MVIFHSYVSLPEGTWGHSHIPNASNSERLDGSLVSTQILGPCAGFARADREYTCGSSRE